MKFVSVRELRLRPGEVWKLAGKEKDLVLTSNGRPIAILTGVDEETFEKELETIRRARALTALEEVQRESVDEGFDRMPDKEIEAEIRAVRREKTR